MNKHVLIVDKVAQSLVKVNESKGSNTNKFLLHGIFTEFDIENRNNRIYTADNFIPVLNKLIEKKNTMGVLYGEFDHPDVFDITGRNVSHVIEDMRHNEAKNRVDGTIALLSNSLGMDARAIINDGYPLFVSSRAAGITTGSKEVIIKELFTYDVVVDPGFASSRVSMNESMGYGAGNDVSYRIYEMNDSQVNMLFNDNKNDRQTKMDLSEMYKVLKEEAAKIEESITNKIKTQSPEEVRAMMEKYDTVNEELSNINEYLEFLKTKISYLFTENKKLTKSNNKLKEELNENTMYSNHLASYIKNLDTNYNNITERLDVDEKMLEYVAKHTKAAIEFSEYIAENVKMTNEELKIHGAFVDYLASESDVTQKFAENTARELDITQKFAENTAKELDITQKFVENNARELDVTQKFAENTARELDVTQKFTENNARELDVTQKFLNYTAEEVHKDDIFLNYIAEKVDGIIDYSRKTVESIKNTKLNINESAMNDEDSIYNIDNIDDYLGLNDEREIINNINDEESAETEEINVIDNIEDTEDIENIEDTEDIEDIENIEDTENTEDIEDTEDIESIELEDSNQDELLSKLVRILSSDETGVIIEIKDDVVTIQKSGSDETLDLGQDEYEIIDTENNIEETVENVLSEIKKQKVLAENTPHFFNFLSEQQLSDFKNLDKPTQEAIILAMNESEYYDSTDVLRVIKDVLNSKNMSYEERLIKNIPTDLKEHWNALSKEQKMSIIVESKYFNLLTSSDIVSFWKTQPFAKKVNSNNAKIIKESLEIKEDEQFSDEFVNAFVEQVLGK